MPPPLTGAEPVASPLPHASPDKNVTKVIFDIIIDITLLQQLQHKADFETLIQENQ